VRLDGPHTCPEAVEDSGQLHWRWLKEEADAGDLE
jgi:hypothetical protein